jgi:hypothetical protein
MTTAFQWVFDNAESISIDRKAVVAQTTSRDQTIRSVSRGGQVWRFEVKLPDGIRWSDARSYIEAIDYADRYTIGNVQINNPGYNSWLTPYQGDSVNSTGFFANVQQGSTTISLNASPTTTSGLKFQTGDIVQLGTGNRVYSVVANVAYNSNTVTLNRPILDTTNTNVNILVGPTVTWRVVCAELPSWTIFARDQVSWSGSFKFVEYML